MTTPRRRKTENTESVEETLERIAREFPLTIHTGAGRLTTTVRRMKAERDAGIPIHLRTGFAISVKTGKAANEMAEAEWEEFYSALCDQLKRDYPEIYEHSFGRAKQRRKPGR